MRAALDTNTIVSGLLWGGKPGQVVDLVTERVIEAVTSEALIAELSRILLRPKFQAQLAARRHSVATIVALYRELAECVEPVTLPEQVPGLRDADDRHILACAAAARAEFIVTGDRGLLELATCQDVVIISAEQCLQRSR